MRPSTEGASSSSAPRQALLVAAACGLLLGCSANSVATDPDARIQTARHVLEFESRGEPGQGSDIARVVAGIKGQENGRVLVFIHGANNSFSKGRARARRQAPEILSSGQYPVFVNWRSSFLTSYRDDLFRIVQGKDLGLHPSSFLAPFRFLADVGRMVFRTPWVATQQVKTLERTRREAGRNVEILKGVDSLEEAWGEDHIWLGETCDERPVRALKATAVGIVTVPTTKLVTNMIMDAFGPGAWHVLQRRTRVLLERDEYFRTRGEAGSGEWAPKDGEFQEPNVAGGLAEFFDQLDEVIKADKKKPEPRDWHITLVGHSTGTLIVNEIVRHHPQLPIRRLVYMAAASSSEDLDRDVVPWLQTETGSRAEVYHLTLHPWQENRQAMLYDIGPRGSIIVAVDDFIDKPSTTTDRVTGRLDNLVRQVQKWPQGVRDVSYVKAFGAGYCKDKARGHPKRHGDFSSRFAYWLDECVQPSGGFPPACDLTSSP